MPGSKPFRALIVEDDLPLQDLLTHFLRSKGFITQAVSTVADGLECLRMQAAPDCMVLDLGLPDGAGTRLLQHIRAKDMATRVAVVTGTADQKLLKEVMKLQPDHILKKPFGLREIEAWLLTATEPAAVAHAREVSVA